MSSGYAVQSRFEPTFPKLAETKGKHAVRGTLPYLEGRGTLGSGQ